MKTRKSILRNPLWWCGILLCLGVSCFARNRPLSNPPQPLATFSGPTMGTRFTVKLVDLPDCVAKETLEKEIHRKLDRVDALMSTYRPESELSRFNRSRSLEWFPVSAETAFVIQEALRIARQTDGALDVTVGPLVDLWQFGPESSPEGSAAHSVSSAEEIETAKGRVGFQHLEVRDSPPALRKKRKDVEIDLSAVAKGYAVDLLAGHLERCGVENYMVEVGGEVRAKGHNQQDRPWQIAVEAPVAQTREIQRIIPLADIAMATSGDYRNYFEQRGVRYPHIIDPRSGRPVAHHLASVTVLDNSCMQADGLATALMVLGPNAAYELSSRNRWSVLLILKTDAGFVERPTPAFQEMFP